MYEELEVIEKMHKKKDKSWGSGEGGGGVVRVVVNVEFKLLWKCQKSQGVSVVLNKELKLL